MDDRTDQGQEPERGQGRRAAAPARAPRSGEGMASVIEHLRRQLRDRWGGLQSDDDSAPEPDDTRPPAG